MLVSYNWLKEYVDIPWSAAELAERLTMAGLEVEGLESLNPGLDRVFVGHVTAVSDHPNADTLKLCSVDVGSQGKFSIVCGAPNVGVGQTVPVALPGAVLPGDFQISETEIRGVKSSGMICSEEELGIGQDSAGIMVLPADTPVGEDFVEALQLDDTVLDVSVYANRPDCMSMIGIAREVAAIAGTKVRYPAVDYGEIEEHITDLADVTVLDSEKCPRYTAKMVKDVKIGPSPLWMQARLRAAGMRPISNVVDITNYVMLELGQPLHAFDYERLSGGRIVVRTAKPGETLTTLDGETRDLGDSMLMICDADRPVCVAGVMGGENTEVSRETNTILLESANFNALNVRRTSRKLGLSSESAARYEKGIDPHGTMMAADRTMHLLAKFAGAQVYAGAIDRSVVDEGHHTVELSLTRANQLFGVDVPEDDAANILEGLGFGVERGTGIWKIEVPSYRGDIEMEADLVEEIARIWGYHKIPTTFPQGVTTVGGQGLRLDVSDRLREILVGCGLQEALTYSFIRPDSNARLLQVDAPPMMKIQNPISEDLSAMRTSLLPGLLSAVHMNSARQQSRVALFELGAVYLSDAKQATQQPQEELRLGIILYGDRAEQNWAVSAEKYDFYDLKGILELLFNVDEFSWDRANNPSFHPGRQGAVLFGDKEVAVYGELHPQVLREFKITDRAYGAEIRLDLLVDHFDQEITYRALPKYPSVDRDLAIIVDKEQAVGAMLAVLEQEGGEFLRSIRVFDVYKGKPIAAGKKSVAFSMRFQADRTLVEKEINSIMERLMKVLREQFGAEIR